MKRSSGQWNWDVRLVRSAQDSTPKKSDQICNGRHQILFSVHAIQYLHVVNTPISVLIPNYTYHTNIITSKTYHILVSYIICLNLGVCRKNEDKWSLGCFSPAWQTWGTDKSQTSTNFWGGFRWASTSTWQPARWPGGWVWSTAGHVERLDFVGSLNIFILSGWWIWPYTGAQVSESATFQAYLCRCPTILDSSCRSNLPAEHGISATTALQLMQRCRCWRKRWIASGQRRVPGQGPARGEDLLFRWLQKITSWGRSPHFRVSKYIQYAQVWLLTFIIRIGL